MTKRNKERIKNKGVLEYKQLKNWVKYTVYKKEKSSAYSYQVIT